MTRFLRSLATVAAIAALALTAPPPVAASDFGDLAAGPCERLVIRGAMVIPGHGGPPAGP